MLLTRQKNSQDSPPPPGVRAGDAGLARGLDDAGAEAARGAILTSAGAEEGARKGEAAAGDPQGTGIGCAAS